MLFLDVSCKSCPTVAALGRLRKMIGFMKQVGDIGMKLSYPEPGSGKIMQNQQKQLSVSGTWGVSAMQTGTRTKPRGTLHLAQSISSTTVSCMLTAAIRIQCFSAVVKVKFTTS